MKAGVVMPRGARSGNVFVRGLPCPSATSAREPPLTAVSRAPIPGLPIIHFHKPAKPVAVPSSCRRKPAPRKSLDPGSESPVASTGSCARNDGRFACQRFARRIHIPTAVSRARRASRLALA